ncbi:MULTISPECIES: putative monovalent cation/H+ antiporter subunit A [Halomonadaceae]|uniref:putative monovalent cation/H+ antiporter subunit A n=1 Tax=Halomonadaceae TaxID=28256 RepID=UPI00159B49D4|nr:MULTISPECIES: putative monovalent cation/H+ antiporter subunit A [Halomonas]QJQ97026.1 putative monovalent cation/H+ antiporter subunit A [Halomonas sp. PA5]
MQLAVLSGFVLAAFAPLGQRWFAERASAIFALYPAIVALWLMTLLPTVMGGDEVLIYSLEWVPSLGMSLTFVLDGLSLLFALLITIIGTFVLIYAGGYLKGHPDLVRFHLAILAFMASMLGLVLADGLLTLFVFWELTSITSYLLIGFNHADIEARKSARQGLFVTFGGGLALMAGLVLLGVAGDSWSLQEINQSGDLLREHALYLPLLLCLLGGAFTKSAQFPFHFWLPNAMAAPTPVSAYLHSATMVKAGIYLLARLHPSLGGTDAWVGILSVVGAVTMFTGAFLALRHTNIKKLLAYSTIMALGTLTMLLGVGTDGALVAFVTFLLAHSMYKGALFMVAGILDHETGTKDVTAMGGLRHLMPVTAIFASIAALSLAGVPPLFGFLGKELMFETVLGATRFEVLILILSFCAAFLTIAVAAIVVIRPFFGERQETPKLAHEPPASMLAGPVVLASLSLILGLAPALAGVGVVSAAASTVAGEPLDFYLALWHGFNLELMMSIASLILGILVFRNWARIRRGLSRLDPMFARGPEAGYEHFLDGIVSVSEWQTRVLQNGYMRNYIMVMVVTLSVLIGNSLLLRYTPQFAIELDVQFHEAIVALLMVSAALFACASRSRLGAVASVGIMGFCIALTFILFSAPDLGITQLLVETLTVIVLILVLFRLPRFARLSTPVERVRDMLVAGSLGILIMMLVLVVVDSNQFASISGYMIENSVPLAHGRNIVNVILVDYRALDTLGEMFVLALAAIGVYAMLKLRAPEAPRGPTRNKAVATPKESNDG